MEPQKTKSGFGNKLINGRFGMRIKSSCSKFMVSSQNVSRTTRGGKLCPQSPSYSSQAELCPSLEAVQGGRDKGFHLKNVDLSG